MEAAAVFCAFQVALMAGLTLVTFSQPGLVDRRQREGQIKTTNPFAGSRIPRRAYSSLFYC